MGSHTHRPTGYASLYRRSEKVIIFFMVGIKDRRGRKIAVTLYGAGGGTASLTAAALEAALRVKRDLTGKPGLCAVAIKKILGLPPARLEVRLWNGNGILLNAPADIGNFLCDINGIIIRDQYNAGDLAGRTVVDAGANIGVFSLYAWALGAKKVYAFEAVKETFVMLGRNLALNRARPKVTAVNAALGAEKARATLIFNTGGEGSSMIDSGNGDVNRGVTYACRRKVPLTTLDSQVKVSVGFIKMDVEGCEREVLLGAASLIRKYKPILSFSAYHRPADLKGLPAVVHRIRNDYAVALNSFAEKDFYCE